ncbi:MAG: hypothetical protein WC484_03910 [Candidatus Omnitrophota bacterium]
MKKMLAVALMLLVAGTAWAAMPSKRVTCNVNGTTKIVKSADACKALGGVVVEGPKVAKKI